MREPTFLPSFLAHETHYPVTFPLLRQNPPLPSQPEQKESQQHHFTILLPATTSTDTPRAFSQRPSLPTAPPHLLLERLHYIRTLLHLTGKDHLDLLDEVSDDWRLHRAEDKDSSDGGFYAVFIKAETRGEGGRYRKALKYVAGEVEVF